MANKRTPSPCGEGRGGVVFDPLRHKYVALTPEEEVRQRFTAFLIEQKGYPKGLMANEVELKFGDKKVRCDGVLYDKQLTPRMIMEYKAPTVKLTQKVITQIATYNMLLHVDYLMISNGQQHLCFRMDYEGRRLVALSEIPHYTEL